MTAHSIVEVSVTVEHLPRYDPSHGTPDPMVRRALTVRLPKGEARFEQTDYGHPGRFNPWDPRGIDTRLQAHTGQLHELCALISALLE